MSTASKCDRCNTLFEDAVGDIQIDVNMVEAVEHDGRRFNSWEFDLCAPCSKLLKEFLGEQPFWSAPT